MHTHVGTYRDIWVGVDDDEVGGLEQVVVEMLPRVHGVGRETRVRNPGRCVAAWGIKRE